MVAGNIHPGGDSVLLVRGGGGRKRSQTHEIPEDRKGGQLIYIPYVLGFSTESNMYLAVQKLFLS